MVVTKLQKITLTQPCVHAQPKVNNTEMKLHQPSSKKLWLNQCDLKNGRK